MKDFLSQLKKATVTVAIVSIILGMIFVIFPSTSLKIICVLVGALFILIGAVLVIMYFFSSSQGIVMISQLIFGIILAVFGIIVCAKSQTFISIIQIIIGAFVLVEGVTNLVRSVQIKTGGSNIGFFSLICSIAIIVLGIVIVANPFDSAKTFTVIIGISLIAYGIIDLLTAYKVEDIRKKVEVDDNVVYVQEETTEQNQED